MPGYGLLETVHEGYNKNFLTMRQMRGLREAKKRLLKSIPASPNWSSRVNNSFVYMVRVIAIPVPDRQQPIVNSWTGPPIADRKATLVCSGGWIVPPMEERQRFRRVRFHDRYHHWLQQSGYEGVPKGQSQPADPVQEDHTMKNPVSVDGLLAPLWMEVAEPSLEDVYWMVWEMMSAKHFVGFRMGGGAGHNPVGSSVLDLAGHNPFKSPSPFSMFHTANSESGMI
jgi:hypothetical protein